MLKNIAAAFQFLTILPLPVNSSRENLEKSMPWFPLVGAVIGLITGFGYRLFTHLLTGNLSAVLTILLYIVLTRGLHLDGFMDTIDGFFSHPKNPGKESILKIMKDPAVGSFAVLGAIIWALLLTSAIPHLDIKDHVLILSFSRLSILLLPLFFSYPKESGTGKFFADHVKPLSFLMALLITLVITAATYFIDGSGRPDILIPHWGALVLISFLIALLTGFWSKRKIGGITGDILGFIIETNFIFLALL